MKFLSLIALFVSTGAFAQTTWTVDPGHTSIIFRIDHMGFSNVMGMFPGAEGKIVWDDKTPANSKFDISVNAADLVSGDKKRDDHLRGPDFFNTKQNPKIVLKSKSVKKTGADTYDVGADLTMRGVTKPVNMTFKSMKTGKDPMGKERTGGEAKFKVKRSDFGVNYGLPAIGDEVEMVVNIEATK